MATEQNQEYRLKIDDHLKVAKIPWYKKAWWSFRKLIGRLVKPKVVLLEMYGNFVVEHEAKPKEASFGNTSRK